MPSYSKICYRRLIACFSDPLQETHCLFLGSIAEQNETPGVCSPLLNFYVLHKDRFQNSLNQNWPNNRYFAILKFQSFDCLPGDPKKKQTSVSGLRGNTGVCKTGKYTYLWIPNEKSDYFGPIFSKILLSEKRYLQQCMQHLAKLHYYKYVLQKLF